MIGRRAEIKELNRMFDSRESEFVAIYGRRRVGKTYLVRETFAGQFAFSHTGLNGVSLRRQLAYFFQSLKKYGCTETRCPADWFEAFLFLGKTLERAPEGRKVVFIDELPWMDTPKSEFLAALGAFWNDWCSARKDVLLIVCGSASSWIVNRLFRNKGALHNRVTCRIRLMPFTLGECEKFVAERALSMSRPDIAECYMAVGGIPYYWHYLSDGLSLAQNLDRMFFAANAPLKDEFAELYSSLFKKAAAHMKVVSALAGRKSGLTRAEIAAKTGIPADGKLTDVLETLAQSGFIQFQPLFGSRKRGGGYRLVDEFSLFHFAFLASGKGNPAFWQSTVSSPAQAVWRGLAFERLCMQHVPQIKMALGIQGVEAETYMWKHVPDESSPQGAQIDLIIDRADRVVDICEMKFTGKPYAIDKDAFANRQAKIDVFRTVTGTRKGIQLVFVTSAGLARTQYSGIVNREITLDDLFT